MEQDSGSGRQGSWNDGSGWGSGPGGAKGFFFRGLRRNMEKKGWRTVAVRGFEWAAIESEHFDVDTVYAAFDADASTMLEGAYLKLDRWAEEAGAPQKRIAIAVFDRASRKDVEFATTRLQDGTFAGRQAMTAVVDLRTGTMFPPTRGENKNRIRLNEPMFQELRSVAEILALACGGE